MTMALLRYRSLIIFYADYLILRIVFELIVDFKQNESDLIFITQLAGNLAPPCTAIPIGTATTLFGFLCMQEIATLSIFLLKD